jgi:hypothetical protein
MPIGTATIIRRASLPAGAARLASALVAAAMIVALAAPRGQAAPILYHTDFGRGQIVPLASSIPHTEGAMVDRRIAPDLHYLARRYPIFLWEGYAGPLPGVGKVGCRRCHVKHSDHFNGLGVDIVPLYWDGRGCDSSWRPVTRLARWAEPRQNHPRLPFRWVGYDGDYDHGCGNHLHLSWAHAPAPPFRAADWVAVFDVSALPAITSPPWPPPPLPPVPPETP